MLAQKQKVQCKMQSSIFGPECTPYGAGTPPKGPESEVSRRGPSSIG